MRVLTITLLAVLSLAPVLGSAAPPAKKSAAQLLRDKNWKAAADEFQRTLRRQPANADAHTGLGIALWGLGERDAALASFRRAIDSNPSSADSHYNIALAFRDFGENARAMSELETALMLRPEYVQARMMLALLLQQERQPDQAIEQYRRILKQNPASAEAHNWLGVALLQKTAIPEAIAEFRAAIRLNPAYARAHNNLGSALAETGDIEGGLASFRAGLRHAPNDVQLRLNLAMALRTKGDADAAVHQFQLVLKRQPRSPEVHHHIGQTLRQKGDLNGAIAAFEQALALDPELREGYYSLGQTLKQAASAMRRGGTATQHVVKPPAEDHLKRASEEVARADLRAARESLATAVEADPYYAEAWNLLGFVQGRSGDMAAAITSLRRAVALKPDLADARYNLGVALWYGGDRRGAVAELDEAVRLNPAAGEAYSFRGMIYREAGEFARARQVLQRALALSPTLPAPYIDLGIVFLKTGRLADALGQFEAALNLPSRPASLPDVKVVVRELRGAMSDKPGDAAAYNVLGRLLGVAGAGAEEVIAAFQEAIRLKPDYAEAHNNLGLVYTQRGDDEKAIASYQEAVRHQPDYADAHANLGAVLTAANPTDAVKELETAVRLQPASIAAQFNLGLAYGSSPAHGVDKEIEQLKKVTAAAPDFPRVHFALGRALLRQNRPKDAIPHLEQAVRLDASYGEAHYQLGLALSRDGRQQEGLASIAKGRELIAAVQREQTAALDLSEGRAALAAGQLDHAIAKFRQVARLKPEAAEAHYQLGAALGHTADKAAARAALEKALELNPWHEAARQGMADLQARNAAADRKQVELAESHIRAQKFGEAEALLLSYVKERPNSAWGWYALGYSQFGQRKMGEAIRSLARSLELNVKNADAHNVLGRCLMFIGRFDAAQVEFEQAARLNPGSAEVRYNLGKLFSIQDNWARAKTELTEALRLDADYMAAHDALGFALEALGEEAAAIASYEKAIQLNEAATAGFSTPYVNLSACYTNGGNTSLALRYARKAIEVNPASDRAWFQLGRAQERNGEFAAAVESLKRAIAINGRVGSYHYVLGTLARRLGRTEESRQAMETFSRLNEESNALEARRREALREEAHE